MRYLIKSYSTASLREKIARRGKGAVLFYRLLSTVQVKYYTKTFVRVGSPDYCSNRALV